MKKEIHKSVTRDFNLAQLKAWYIGEKDYLKNMLGVGWGLTGVEQIFGCWLGVE